MVQLWPKLLVRVTRHSVESSLSLPAECMTRAQRLWNLLPWRSRYRLAEVQRPTPWQLRVPYKGYNRDLMARVEVWQQRYAQRYGHRQPTWDATLKWARKQDDLDVYNLASTKASQISTNFPKTRAVVTEEDIQFVLRGSDHAQSHAWSLLVWHLGPGGPGPESYEQPQNILPPELFEE